MSEPDGYGPGVLVPSEDADPRGSRAGSPRPHRISEAQRSR